ncbi:MAG: polyisoprenyl-teichoic acid--peptidoglycan teichoic acid transferase [Solirubrobacteraceae bacterium]|nr:polyisoprenyl-teichoic acid--peptidoglycan teichoic acid transferase [Solirubrobacteraceae bacterium]
MSVFGAGGHSRFDASMVKRFVLGAVLVVLFSATAVASALLLEVKDDIASFKFTSKPIPHIQDFLQDVPAGQAQTILLLGSDRRFADIGKVRPRSDTIIVARLDPDLNATAIMSIPRDLLVDVPGYGMRKINEAFHLGGEKLTIRTVSELLSIDINHVISVNFGGFERAVNRLGCVYADVDRRYFNDNAGGGEHYATIDLKPGYQKLCGKDALDYVRFRHEDSDFVRAARQQEFLRQAKEQIGLGKLFGDRKELLRIFGRYTETDISQRDTAEILGLIKLAYESSKEPLTEIRFPATDCPDRSCVQISTNALIDTVQRFIDVRGNTPVAKTPKKVKRVRRTARLAPGLVYAQQEGENHVLAMSVRLEPLGLPVYFPKARLAGGAAGYVSDGSPRSYEIFDRNHNRYRSYRIVLYAGQLGQYYGVQGTTWKAPPILDNPTDERIMRGRTYRRYFDGKKIRLIAFQTPKAVYWVTNTLNQVLTNRQMMDVARSLQRIGE